MAIDLAETLRLHSLWLRRDPAGVRADLRDADLRGANLRGANLRGAALRRADLCGADLRDSDLRDSDLRDVNLCGANLCGANLREVSLCRVSLCGAQGVPIAEDAPARLQAVAATVLAQPDALNMGSWHSDCGTTHCLAGWAIHLAGPLGAVLEQLHGPALAGLLLLGSEAAQHFYDSNETTLNWLRSIHNTEQETADAIEERILEIECRLEDMKRQSQAALALATACVETLEQRRATTEESSATEPSSMSNASAGLQKIQGIQEKMQEEGRTLASLFDKALEPFKAAPAPAAVRPLDDPLEPFTLEELDGLADWLAAREHCGAASALRTEARQAREGA